MYFAIIVIISLMRDEDWKGDISHCHQLQSLKSQFEECWASFESIVTFRHV